MFYKKINYPDGSSYATVPKSSPEIDYQKDSIFRVNTYEDLWYLNQFVDAMNNMGISPTITIPWLIDGQADRRFNINESSGLKLVCEFLNNMNANFKIFHPHNAEVVEALMDDVEIIDNSEFIQNVLYDIECDISINKGNDNYPKDLVILLPDGGAYKWGVKLMDKIGFQGDVLAAAKNRKYVDGKSILTQQLPNYNFKGKSILLLDDCCIGGGTFKGLSKLLKEQGVDKVYLAVSHMTVQNLGEDPVTNYFDKVYCTNSKFDRYIADYSKKTNDKPSYIPINLEIIKLF